MRSEDYGQEECKAWASSRSVLHQYQASDPRQALHAQVRRRQGAVPQVGQHRMSEALPQEQVGGFHAVQVRQREEPQGQDRSQAVLPHGGRQGPLRQKRHQGLRL